MAKNRRFLHKVSLQRTTGTFWIHLSPPLVQISKLKIQISNSGFQIAILKFQILNFKFHIPIFKYQIPNFKFQIFKDEFFKIQLFHKGLPSSSG